MVKLKGPGLSARTTGTIADVLTFSQSKGRPYMKKHARPKQAETQPQRANQQMVGFLARNWSGLSTADHNTWQPLAHTKHIGGYHQFIATNSQRWHNFRSPSKQYPAAEIITPSPDERMYSTGGKGFAELKVNQGTGPQPWGVAIFRAGPAIYVPSPATFVYAALMTTNPFTYIRVFDTPPGFWKWMHFVFFDDGTYQINTRQTNCLVT